MSSIAGASKLYILPGANPAVLVPDSSGVPELLDPQPLILRAAYVGPDLNDSSLANARQQLAFDHCPLLVPHQSPDGPPYRSGMIFTFQGYVSGVSWKDEHISHHGFQMLQYAAATPIGMWQWTQDAQQGRPGYFVTGRSAEAALWHMFRLEVDALGHEILTLAPILFTPGCPQADFSSIADSALRAELTAQYDEFCQRVVAHGYRDALTKARNIVEGLVAYKLGQQGQRAHKDLGKDLQTVQGLLKGSSRASCGWSDLEYHLAHKIRLLHGQTHAVSVTTSGRAIRPEFALTVAEDLAELMRGWGYLRVP